MQGRRRPDGTEPHLLEPGDFAKRQVTRSGKTFMAWWLVTPNGHLGRLSMPEDTPDCHHVEEHEDGMITVVPQPNNSNSILVEDGRGSSWHGYIHHGEWRHI